MTTQETNFENGKKDMNRRMYIGVPNFKFHHATDEYSGFIGRVKIKERLKDLLTGESGNKVSGAYLITGNRGVGKTTFVNKVKSEIEDKKIFKSVLTPIFVILGVLLINTIQNLGKIVSVLNIIYIIFTIGICSFTLLNALHVTNKSLYRNAGFFKKISVFFKISFYLNEIKEKGRFVYFLHLLAISILIVWTSLFVYEYCGVNHMHLVLALIYAFVYTVHSAYCSYKSHYSIKNGCKDVGEIKLKDFPRYFIHRLIDAIKYLIKKNWITIYRFINEPKRIFIKINLGHDKLKVIDVLRLISHHVYVEYRNFLYSGLRYTTRLFFVVFFSLVIAKLISLTGLWHSITGKAKSTFSCLEDFAETYDKLCLHIYNIFISLWKYASETVLDTIEPCESCEPFISLDGFVLFLLIILLYKSFTYFPYLRLIPTPFSYLKELHDLINSISSSIRMEEGAGIDAPIKKLGISLNRKIEKTYPMSDARDIEKRLIGIVDKINKTKFHRVRFILIFDELDKLESSFSEKQEEFIKSDSFSPDTIRKRREAVYTLLSGLKYLLTTMKAKFVFIAGRELYEAFRADASDRSHYLSSIFNDVIVVPSFMTDTPEDKRHDIFCMTEQYVCRSLMPESYNTNEYYLDNYKKFLEKVLDFKNPDEKKLVIQKTLIILYNFIVYLTYASKGAPKKMVNLLERHIINKGQMQNEYDVDNADRHITVYTGNSSFYLRFDYYDMYMFALMSRIVLPVVYRFDRGKKHKYGDKLLVTSMFFLDHLYKFHRNSFSWRALEASPEIIDVNKIPELREHINDILHYISQNDLKNISNGLYDFRFYKKIAQEISFLTRVSETASAFFNFTLDETYSVKQYYQRKLEKIRKEYDSDKIPVKNTVDELASIHFTLGELYLYEEEIGDAVVEFDMAVSILYTIEPAEMTSEQIVLLMKAMLSIGIAYEKQNQNDRALLIYIECVKFLIASKNTNINEFGLVTEENASGKMFVYPYHAAWNRDEPKLYFNKIQRYEEKSLIKAVEDVNHMHPAIHGFLSKIAAFDTLRLLYLPILAKLQILEKIQTGGLQFTDLQRCMKEFGYLANMMNKENKNILISNFFLKVGDILYYKNSNFVMSHDVFENLLRVCFIDNDTLDIPEKDFQDSITNNTRKHNDAYYFYSYALKMLLYGTSRKDYSMSLFETVEFLNCERGKGYNNWDEGKYILLATILTNFGDTILAELHKSTNVQTENEKRVVFNFLREFVRRRKEDKKKSIINLLYDMITGVRNHEYENNRLIEIISYYILAYMYFKKGTSNNMASFQCYRILLVFKYHISSVNIEDKENGIEEIARYFTNCSIIEKGASFKEMHFEDASNWIRVFGVEDNKNMELPDCRNLLYDESLETILLYLGIKLNTIDKPCQIQGFQKMFKTLRYDNIGSILNRIKWLKFMSEVNIKEIQVELGINPNISSPQIYELIQKAIDVADVKTSSKKRVWIGDLLQNTIEKLYEAISLIKLYGENYALTNYYVADIYHKMMCVLKWKKDLLDKWRDDKKFTCLFKNIGFIYNTDVYESISWANVNRHYYKSKEMHEEGRTYKDMINRSCFLNDEFSDQRLHFITAHERWQTSGSDFSDLLKGDISKPINGNCTLKELFKEIDYISKNQD